MDTQVTDSQLERRRKRRRGIVALLGAVSLLTIGAGSISLAQFTDSATDTWAFSTGTIDVNTSPAVLTAIYAPELLVQSGTVNLSLDNARLLAGLVAIAVAWRLRRTFLTIFAGMLALHFFGAVIARAPV